MPVTIQGIRLRSLTISNEGGHEDIGAEYELISSNGAVLAKNSLRSKVESYSSANPFTPSLETIRKIREAVASYKKDAEVMLGFE